MELNLVKENIECEQLLGENFVDTPIKGEYVIPDTHPDVQEILMIESKPSITNKEVIRDNVYIEGIIDYNVFYLGKEEETVLYNVTYTTKFSNEIQISKAETNMSCQAECFIEDMQCKIVNERKISIQGIVKLKGEVYKDYNFEIIKDLDDVKDIQMLRNPISVDKIVGTTDGELIAKSNMKISSDKPEVESILRYDVNIHKKQVRVLDNMITVEAFAHIGLIYRAKDSKDICYLEDDVFINKDIELEDVNSSMDNYTDFVVDAVSIDVKEDDLGERRIIDLEALIKANIKVMYKKEIEVIEDIYSPTMKLTIDKKDYELNVMQGHSNIETIVKSNIDISSDMPRIREIIMSSANVYITDKKLVEDKVLVEGVLNVEVMYKTTDKDKYIYTVKDNIPFSSAVEIPNCKINMHCIVKATLEDIETSIEANTIAVKAIVNLYSRVNYVTNKEFLVNVEAIEDEVPQKKSSITIYVVQQGDTLWKIAKRYYTTVDTLILINDIENADVIKPGQKLIIPGRAVI